MNLRSRHRSHERLSAHDVVERAVVDDAAAVHVDDPLAAVEQLRSVGHHDDESVVHGAR